MNAFDNAGREVWFLALRSSATPSKRACVCKLPTCGIMEATRDIMVKNCDEARPEWQPVSLEGHSLFATGTRTRQYKDRAVR